MSIPVHIHQDALNEIENLNYYLTDMSTIVDASTAAIGILNTEIHDLREGYRFQLVGQVLGILGLTIDYNKDVTENEQLVNINNYINYLCHCSEHFNEE